jgi:RNA polymerase sigma factor (sigma-70 family)
MSQGPPDDALVEAARQGSSSAYGLLVRRHQQAVRGFLRRLLGGHADADDLAQEVFLTAWGRLSAYRGETRLSVWLCGIAYNKALSHLRSNARRRTREAVAMEGADQAATPHESARLDAARALSGLSVDERAAVALCLAADFSHSEAADALGLPLGTIKSHVQRGRAKLLVALGDPS